MSCETIVTLYRTYIVYIYRVEYSYLAGICLREIHCDKNSSQDAHIHLHSRKEDDILLHMQC